MGFFGLTYLWVITHHDLLVFAAYDVFLAGKATPATITNMNFNLGIQVTSFQEYFVEQC